MTDNEYGRNYQENGSSRATGTAITITKGRSKTDYSSERGWHPDDALNQEYIDQKGSMALDRPLCFAIHNGEICKRPARRGARYCYVGRGDV